MVPTFQAGRKQRWYYYFCLLQLALVGSCLGTTDGQTAFDITTTNIGPFGASPQAGHYFSARGARPGFVSAPGDGHLYIDGELFDFRSFNSPTMLEGGEFETRDLAQTISAFGSPVTRTYTLRVANTMFADGKQAPADAHVLGWNNYLNDWTYNETNWRKIDKALDLSRQHGVRLIIPIINQDYGSPDTNWKGNFNDLIRHRYDIRNYTEAQQRVDWFTDRAMISSFKQLITHLLNRINTYNGIRIGDDQTVLAFETGNEMNWAQGNWTSLQRPAPSNWTIEIAKHIKSLAPKTLVMDGSYSRNATMAWEDEVLDSPHVDLYSYHFYGTGDTLSYPQLEERVRAHGKTFIVGEHGFYDKVEVYESFYKNMTCAGALIWSLRPHSEKGGFVTHGEGNNIYSYHAPGFRNQTSTNFDTQEADVVSSTYDASYRVLRLEPPPKPVPGPPEAFLVTNGTHTGISWRGSAWAQQYEIYSAVVQNSGFNQICHSLTDNVDAGKLFVPLDARDPTKPISVTKPAPISEKSHAGWVDTKWRWSGSVSTGGGFWAESAVAVENQQVYWPLPANTSTPPSANLPPSFPPFSGGWFSVRAISPDRVPGGTSQSVFLTIGAHPSSP